MRLGRAAGVVASCAALCMAMGCAGARGAPPQVAFVPAGMLSGHTDQVLEVAVDPAGDHLASASADDTVRLWDLATLGQVGSLEHPDDVYSVAFDPSGSLLASGCRDGRVRLFPVELLQQGKAVSTASPEVREIVAHNDAVYSVAFSPDGSVLATASEDLSIRLWDASTGSLLRVLTGHAKPVHDVEFLPNGALVASASSDQTVRLWYVADGRLAKMLRPGLRDYAAAEYALAVSPDGAMVYSGGNVQPGDEQVAYVREWSASSGNVLRTFTGHSGDIWRLRTIRGGSWLVGAGRAGVLYFWELGSGALISQIALRAGPIWGFALSPAEDVICVAARQPEIRVLRLAVPSE